MSNSDIYEETARCIRCGYCLSTCPTYAVTGLESSVARGRNFYAKSLIEQKIEESAKVKKSLFECLLCGACVDSCAPQVQTDEIMVSMRSDYIEKFGQPPLQRYLFKELLIHPERMARLMKMISLGKRSGISGLVQALRVFGWFGKNIAEMESLVKTFPKKFFREFELDFPLEINDAKMKVGYFLGCGINYAFPDVGVSTLKVLNKNKFDIHIYDNYCCGLPASGYGDLDAAREFAHKNLQVFAVEKVDYIITDCASCASYLKDYNKLVIDDSFKDLADKYSDKIYDVTEFYNKFTEKDKLQITEQKTVTYHDPCHLSHYLHITKPPRTLLQNIENVNYIELPEADWCCGGAGTYNISHREMSMKILARKIENLKNTNAQILTTSCPGCIVQLSYGVRKFKLPVEVKHISQLLLEALQD